MTPTFLCVMSLNSLSFLRYQIWAVAVYLLIIENIYLIWSNAYLMFSSSFISICAVNISYDITRSLGAVVLLLSFASPFSCIITQMPVQPKQTVFQWIHKLQHTNNNNLKCLVCLSRQLSNIHVYFFLFSLNFLMDFVGFLYCLIL